MKRIPSILLSLLLFFFIYPNEFIADDGQSEPKEQSEEDIGEQSLDAERYQKEKNITEIQDLLTFDPSVGSTTSQLEQSLFQEKRQDKSNIATIAASLHLFTDEISPESFILKEKSKTEERGSNLIILVGIVLVGIIGSLFYVLLRRLYRQGNVNRK